MPNITGPGKTVTVNKKEKPSQVLHRIERRRGIPMSKAPRFADSFKVRLLRSFLAFVVVCTDLILKSSEKVEGFPQPTLGFPGF